MTKRMWQITFTILIIMTVSTMATSAMGSVFADIVADGTTYKATFPGGGVLDDSGYDLHFHFSESMGAAVVADAYDSARNYLGYVYVYVNNPYIDLGFWNVNGPVKYLDIWVETGPAVLTAVEGFYPATPPVAGFICEEGYLTVTFTDTSTGSADIVGWNWTFGDGGTSSLQNPAHTYLASGAYTVTLTVTDSIGAEATATASVTAWQQVSVDVKPGSSPNTVNLGSNGVVPVAILSDERLDALSVDPGTVKLEGKVGVRAKGNGSYFTEQRDVNGDGRTDLIVKIETCNLQPGDIQDGLAEITGQTTSGILFKGMDEVTIVPQ